MRLRASRRATALTAAVIGLMQVVAAPLASAKPRIRSEPEALIAGEVSTARLHVEGAALRGPVRAAVNVGEVTGVTTEGGAVVVDYRMPRGRHPRRLCLLLWSDEPPAEVITLRVPLVGRTKIPVRTRRDSTVVIRVGGKTFGPVKTGKRGRAKIPVLVPPQVSHAEVEVTDRAQLKSTKRVRIRRRRYPQIAVAAVPTRTSEPRVRVDVVVAAADSGAARLTINGPGGPLAVEPRGPLQWRASWQPDQRPAEGEHELEVRGRIDRRSFVRRLKVTVLEARARPSAVAGRPSVRGPTKVKDRPVAAVARRRLHGIVGLGAGVWGNLGVLVSPRFTLEAGIDYQLSWGIIGARLEAAVSWASQSIADPAPLASAESSVLVVPLSLALCYRYPLRLMSPYLMPALVGHLIRTANSGEGIEERVRYDLVAGFSLRGGVSRRIGPGRLYVQGGFLLGKLEVEEVNLPAGGVVFEAGYRLVL